EEKKYSETDLQMEDKENVSARSNGVNEPTSMPVALTIVSKFSQHNNSTVALVPKYLVKYNKRSYHHAEWLTEKEIGELQGESKLKYFIQKFFHESTAEHLRLMSRVNHAIERNHFENIHFFNPLYLKIERIIDVCEPNEVYKQVRHYKTDFSIRWSDSWVYRENQSGQLLYLVKWVSMQYDETTWETESFLMNPVFNERYDGIKEIEMFRARQQLPDIKQLNLGPKLNTERYQHRPKTWNELTQTTRFKHDHELRSYQISGVNWLVHNWLGRRSCILADEMGLGKTVQTVTFLNQLVTQFNVRGPFLIVAPLSTLGHWSREFKAWSDLNVIVYHGTALCRSDLHSLEFCYEHKWLDETQKEMFKDQDELDSQVNAMNQKFNVMLTTPDVIKAADNLLNWNKVKWRCIIIDEAHCLKHRSSLVYRTLSTFKNPDTDLFQTHVVLLTGTPIQNDMQELFSLLHFMDPKEYPSESAFLKEFPPDRLHECQAALQKCLKARLLQRFKALVEKDLQDREEKIIWVELTFFQKKWYRAVYEKSYDSLRKLGAARTSLMNVAMQLRKCCNHPFLIHNVEQTMSPEGTSETMIMENLIRACGKMILLDKLLPKLKMEGHRVLIFSQMTRVLNIIEDFLMYRGYFYERVDGSVTGIERQEAIDRFTINDQIFAFLLTTRAGGVGINLMAADTVIIFDSDWNPMNDIQAIARAHRIGQTKKVNVYRIITQGTYEEEMFQRADRKLALSKIVMGDLEAMTKTEMADMLKRGAIRAFLKETDNEIEKFTNATIDEILSTRCQKWETRDQGTDEKITNHDSKEGALFSEAHFAANTEDPEVDWNAADFWDRVVDLKMARDEDSEKEENVERRGKYRMRARKKNQKNEDYSEELDLSQSKSKKSDEECDERREKSLLGAMLRYFYGQWHDIYHTLSNTELELLKLQPPQLEQALKSETKANESEPSDKQLGNVFQLIKPEIRISVLKSKDALFMDPLLKKHTIETYVYQLFTDKRLEKLVEAAKDYKQKIEKLCDDLEVKEQKTKTAKSNDEATETIGKSNSKNKSFCKHAQCKRWINEGLNEENFLPWTICCKGCSQSDGKFHDVKCDRRYAKQFVHDCVNAIEARYPAANGAPSNVNEGTMKDELTKYSTETMLNTIQASIISKEHLRNILISNICGDVRSIAQQLERMFVFRGICCHVMGVDMDCREPIAVGGLPSEKAFEKLRSHENWQALRAIKTMPTWWNKEWDYQLVKGTLIFGWGNIPQSWIVENKLQVRVEAQIPANDDVIIVDDGSGEMFKGKWIKYNRQSQRLTQISSSFRKLVRESYQKMHRAQVKAITQKQNTITKTTESRLTKNSTMVDLTSKSPSVVDLCGSQDKKEKKKKKDEKKHKTKDKEKKRKEKRQERKERQNKTNEDEKEKEKKKKKKELLEENRTMINLDE
ncbi:hypothetical protein RFI_05292, partial [Reticulomyxa filosa]